LPLLSAPAPDEQLARWSKAIKLQKNRRQRDSTGFGAMRANAPD
jgi:hypothetical protein